MAGLVSEGMLFDLGYADGLVPAIRSGPVSGRHAPPGISVIRLR